MQFKPWLFKEHKQEIDKKFLSQYGHYKVYIVNGMAVRNVSPEAEEFGESGTFRDYEGIIPKNEIWIEDDVEDCEIQALVAGRLYELKCLAKGMSADKAYKLSLKREQKYRNAVEASEHEPSAHNDSAAEKIYVKKYGYIKDEDITVWLVDGEEVREHYKHDFLEGGHGYVYKWVPNNEIWIENQTHLEEVPVLILHEYVERILMKYYKIKYDRAHEIAAKTEFNHRHENFSKQEALNLTKKKALEMAKDSV